LRWGRWGRNGASPRVSFHDQRAPRKTDGAGERADEAVRKGIDHPDPGEKTDVAGLHPDIVQDLEGRLLAYAKQQKPSEWIKAQPAFVGEQGKTVFDPAFDIDDGGLPHERPALPTE